VRFWDPSALVPLLVEEPASKTCDAWLREDPSVAAWTLTPVELSSALRRLVRAGHLAEGAAMAAEARADELFRACHTIIDVEGVKARARRLLRVHALRAADALQLGAALAWADDAPSERELCTFDEWLALAAAREGFTVRGACLPA
jgi:uncharacterized protein